MTHPECEIVADAGVRLRIIADGMIAAGKVFELGGDYGGYMNDWARAVDEVRVRLCALPLEAEGETSA